MSRFTRLMEWRVPFWLLALTVQFMLLGFIAFGSIVVDTLEGQRNLGGFGDAITEIASIPQTLRRSRTPETRMNAPEPRPKIPDGLWVNPQAGMTDDGFLLVSRYRAERKRFVVELLDLSSGKILKTWAPDITAIIDRSEVRAPFVNLKRDQGPEMFRLVHPLLTSDGGLVTHSYSPLVRLDRCSRIVWQTDGLFHHATEEDRDGNYWVSYTYAKSPLAGAAAAFQDDALARIAPNGRILQIVPVRKILKDNGLDRMFFSFGYTNDPYHLNDIQPALVDGAFWKAGDLFVSLRNVSMVLLYRPSTGKVLWWRQGSTFKQHDVQILDSHRIALFDNNVHSFPIDAIPTHSREMIYDFATRQANFPFDGAFAAQKIATPTQGRGLIFDNGDVLVEETDYGRMLRIAPDGTVRWRYISAKPDGTRTMLGWSRYLEREKWRGPVEKAVKGKCP